jgi:uncharacterized protein YbjT (DUF2867 family)
LGGGYGVRVLTRTSHHTGDHPSVEWVSGSLATGEGLAEAVRGVDILVHAASSPFGARQVDTGGARRLVDLTRQGHLSHFFYISIVGVDRHPFSYYRAKYATERLLEQSRAPWTILRATQFHAFLGRTILPGFDRLPVFLAPTDFVFQLIDEGEVADRIVELLRQGPSGRAQDIGGPEILTWGEIARAWLAAQKRVRRIVHLPLPGKTASAFRRGVHTTPEHKHGRITWAQWLDKTYGEQANDPTP